jgi:hypothetical protein
MSKIIVLEGAMNDQRYKIFRAKPHFPALVHHFVLPEEDPVTDLDYITLLFDVMLRITNKRSNDVPTALVKIVANFHAQITYLKSIRYQMTATIFESLKTQPEEVQQATVAHLFRDGSMLLSAIVLSQLLNFENFVDYFFLEGYIVDFVSLEEQEQSAAQERTVDSPILIDADCPEEIIDSFCDHIEIAMGLHPDFVSCGEVDSSDNVVPDLDILMFEDIEHSIQQEALYEKIDGVPRSLVDDCIDDAPTTQDIPCFLDSLECNQDPRLGFDTTGPPIRQDDGLIWW